MNTELTQHIRKHIPLTAAAMAAVQEAAVPVSCARKELLLQQGQVCRSHYFVRKGCLRMYLITEDGREQTIQFAIEHWWLSDYSSLETGKASVFTIQAVEATTLYRIDATALERLSATVPGIDLYFRKVVQRAYAASLNRIHYIFNLSGEARYLLFRDSYPDFVQRVPQYMLASYLGITPEYLSEIRKKRQ